MLHNIRFRSEIGKYISDSEHDCNYGRSNTEHSNKASGATGSFSAKLANTRKGPVGPKHSEWPQNHFHIPASSGQKATPSRAQSIAKAVGAAGDLGIDLERGSTGVGRGARGRICFHPVSGTKKYGGQRPVINLKNLNSFVKPPHFKMEGIHTLKSLVLEGDWLVKVDPKDAYFSVLISQKHRKFLCFQFDDKSYQFNCLPFDLASAPWVFTKTLKTVAVFCRELGIRMVVYIGNILLMAETKEKARDQASGLVYLLQYLGFTVNMEKTVLEPGQCLEFLGFMVDTTRIELSLSAKKKKDLGGVLTVIRGRAGYSPHPLQINWQDECHKSGDPTSTPVLQEHTNGPGNSSERSGPGLRDSPPDSREELTWWGTQMIKWNGRTVMITEPSLTTEAGECPIEAPVLGGPGPARRRNAD